MGSVSQGLNIRGALTLNRSSPDIDVDGQMMRIISVLSSGTFANLPACL
jgi:hypothetical protein